MNLPAVIDRASRRLAEARSSSEVFKARTIAEAALHYAKVSGAANNTHAECLRLITRCEIRLADEVDQGQERGEVAEKGRRPNVQTADISPATLADLNITRQRLAEWREMRDVGAETIDEWLNAVLQKERAPTKADIHRGLRGLSHAAHVDRLNAIAARPSAATEGVFDVLVIDPPWPMKKIPRDVRRHQVPALDYPTMSEDELLALEIPSANNAHVWLWTTQRFLPLAFRLLEAWRLAYACTFVWHKPGGFQAIGLPQYNCEFALYARHGSPKFVTTRGLSTCFEAPRGQHSEKPTAFYDLVRRVTAGRRLDMFNRRQIDGFIGGGNEAVSQ